MSDNQIQIRTHVYLAGSDGSDRAPTAVRDALSRAGWVWVEDGPEGTVFVARQGVMIEEGSDAAVLISSLVTALWHTACPEEASLDTGCTVIFDQEEIDPSEQVFMQQAAGVVTFW